VPIAVQKKFGEDQAGNQAALIAYNGFLSLFPLMLLAVAVLGFIVQSDAGARQTILNSGLPNIPIIGTTLKDGHLVGSGVAIAVGGIGALWSGLAVTNVLQNAFDQIGGVPYKSRPGFLHQRMRGARLLFAIGLMELVTIALTGVTSAGVGNLALDIAGIGVSILLNLALFAVAFRLLTDASVPSRRLWPGVAMATAGWVLIQAVGGVYVRHVLTKASATYGGFAGVIGLLAWLYLGARVLVYGAELNSVLAHHYWPRSLFDPPTVADDDVRTSLAKVEERVDDQTVAVSFEPSEGARRRAVLIAKRPRKKH